ncbi:MAG: aldo/keto reductase, partial [Pseudomonas sp.]
MSIETIKIPGIDKAVSRIALGTWSMGGSMWGGADNEVSVKTIRHALASGINFIDSAPVYGLGLSEELIGRALRGVRHTAVIATKAGLQWDDGTVRRNATARRIRKEIEDSLLRLETDYIDLYQIHWPDPLVAQEETAGELEKLRREGKILAVGVSNYSPAQMDDFRQYTHLDTVQPPYNLFERAIDSDILPYANQNSRVVLAYGS